MYDSRWRFDLLIYFKYTQHVDKDALIQTLTDHQHAKKCRLLETGFNTVSKRICRYCALNTNTIAVDLYYEDKIYDLVMNKTPEAIIQLQTQFLSKYLNYNFFLVKILYYIGLYIYTHTNYYIGLLFYCITLTGEEEWLTTSTIKSEVPDSLKWKKLTN